MENRAMSKEQFEIVVKVMSLLRSGKISTMTPNCEVRELILAEKAKEDKQWEIAITVSAVQKTYTMK